MEMNLQKYMALVKTAEYGSFTRAAEALAYSQSGISHMVNDLEKEWHVALLERRYGGINLTADGKRLLPYVKQLCDYMAVLQRQIEEVNGLKAAKLCIGVLPSLMFDCIPRILEAFCRDYPEVEMEIRIGTYREMEEWLLDGRVDCSCLCLPTALDVDLVPLREDRIQLCLPKGHHLMNKERVSFADLHGERIILVENNEENRVTHELLKQHNLLDDICISLEDDGVAMNLVERGLGIALFPQLSLQNSRYDVAVRDLEETQYRKICMAVRRGNVAPVVVQCFLEYIRQMI